MKKTSPKKSIKKASSQDLLRPAIEAWEAEIFGDVLKPERSSMIGLEIDSDSPKYDVFQKEECPAVSSYLVSQMAVQRLAGLAKGGDRIKLRSGIHGHCTRPE